VADVACDGWLVERMDSTPWRVFGGMRTIVVRIRTLVAALAAASLCYGRRRRQFVAAHNHWSVLMEKLDQAMRAANPFNIQLEEPMQPSMTAIKYAPKIDDVGDIGRIGSTHSGGDWG
jgi:hypothetical protein